MKDVFELKNIKPMLIAEERDPFDSSDYIYELKLDGFRGIMYLDGSSAILRSKRNIPLNDIFPELTNVYKQIGKRCILDGEIFCMKNGKPSFHEMQKRSLLGNATKIRFAAERLPVSFCAFDILYVDNEQITNRPLMERKCILQEVITENERLPISRYIQCNGTALYNLTAEQDLEGIVAKHKDSRYYIGKSTKEWVKIKNIKDEDFVICGYALKESGIANIILGAFDNGQLVYQGHVALSLSRQEFKCIRQVDRGENPFHDMRGEGVIWIKPVLVCTVKYLERTESGGMRQPVFKGLRDDKESQECTINK